MCVCVRRVRAYVIAGGLACVRQCGGAGVRACMCVSARVTPCVCARVRSADAGASVLLFLLAS